MMILLVQFIHKLLSAKGISNMFSLDHLSHVEFEQFCYDLLLELGFVNLSWRKGTGFDASPSDQGRDIECQFVNVDVDNNKNFLKWYVECKHYKKGVPADRIQSVLTWATANSVDVVLIVVSNFLSNSAKEFLKDYQQNNNLRFRIKLWERPDLEKLTVSKTRLLRKYRIVDDFIFLSILHPAHLLYIREFVPNSIAYLFQILDEIDPTKRDNTMGNIYPFIIRPRKTYVTTQVLDMEIKVSDRTLDEVSYEAFKRKCWEIAQTKLMGQHLLVFLIVHYVLQMSFALGDTTAVDDKIFQLNRTAEFLKDSAENDLERMKEVEHLLGVIQRSTDDLPERAKRNYETYEYFCEHVVSKLLLETIPPIAPLED